MGALRASKATPQSSPARSWLAFKGSGGRSIAQTPPGRLTAHGLLQALVRLRGLIEAFEERRASLRTDNGERSAEQRLICSASGSLEDEVGAHLAGGGCGHGVRSQARSADRRRSREQQLDLPSRRQRQREAIQRWKPWEQWSR